MDTGIIVAYNNNDDNNSFNVAFTFVPKDIRMSAPLVTTCENVRDV